MKFESLIDLINYYMKFCLYQKVKLSYPVSKDIVKRMGNLSLLEDDNAYASTGYMDPSTVARDKVTVKALYDYKAQHDDELSFCKHAIITNVDKKNNQLWWTGDYGGKTQLYFPANYVQEINGPDGFDGDECSNDPLLGHPQKGIIDVSGAVVDLAVEAGAEVEWMIRIHTPAMQNFFKVGCETKEGAVEWRNAIMEAAQNASVLENERRKIERNSKVAKEMSDLIIYCRSTPFKNAGWLFYEMSSFAETKAEKYFLQQEMKVSHRKMFVHINNSISSQLFLRYHRNQISRVYPKGQRLDSSNFHPIAFWNVGSQMIALNYQTPDKPMQLLMGKFRDNGGCGYILKPSFMLTDEYDPNDSSCAGLSQVLVTLRVIAARHLFKSGRTNLSSPLVEVEVLGASYDSGIKHRTKAIPDNGFNPIWNELCEFRVRNSSLALLRFEVLDEGDLAS